MPLTDADYTQLGKLMEKDKKLATLVRKFVQRRLHPMTHGGRRSKGRRLQVEFAETMSIAFGLTIEAVPPTQPGIRKNGAVYLAEGHKPDLRVRRSGEAGVDVALLTSKASACVALRDSLGVARPLYIECKNNESWDLGRRMWETGGDAALKPWMVQAHKGRLAQTGRCIETLILGKNGWPSIVVFPHLGWMTDQMWCGKQTLSPILLAKSFVAVPLWMLAEVLRSFQDTPQLECKGSHATLHTSARKGART